MVTSEPSGLTSSTAQTAVDKMPLPSPEPCVPVAVAPATDIWGSDPVLCSANPCRCSLAARIPYVVPPETDTVQCSASTLIPGSISDSEMSAPPGESAIELKECRVPRALTFGSRATKSWTSSTEAG